MATKGRRRIEIEPKELIYLRDGGLTNEEIAVHFSPLCPTFLHCVFSPLCKWEDEGAILSDTADEEE